LTFEVEKMDWFITCASIYTCIFCVWILFGIYYSGSIYDFLNKKTYLKKILKQFNQKKVMDFWMA